MPTATYPLRPSPRVGGQRAAMVSAPIGLATLGRCARHGTSRANRHSSKLREPVVTSCAPGSAIDSATQRRKQNTFLCVRSLRSHATGNHRYAEPVASHKNMFCLLRPPGARKKEALRLISPPCARPPILGVSALVGPATARAARHVAGPSRTTLNSCPKSCAAGCASRPRNPPRSRPGNRHASPQTAAGCHAGC